MNYFLETTFDSGDAVGIRCKINWTPTNAFSQRFPWKDNYVKISTTIDSVYVYLYGRVPDSSIADPVTGLTICPVSERIIYYALTGCNVQIAGRADRPEWTQCTGSSAILCSRAGCEAFTDLRYNLVSVKFTNLDSISATGTLKYNDGTIDLGTVDMSCLTGRCKLNTTWTAPNNNDPVSTAEDTGSVYQFGNVTVTTAESKKTITTVLVVLVAVLFIGLSTQYWTEKKVSQAKINKALAAETQVLLSPESSASGEEGAEAKKAESLSSKHIAHLKNELQFKEHNVALKVDNLNYFLSNGSGFQVLHGVSFDVKAGELLAVIGPSGSGKTCTLDILANRRGGSELRAALKQGSSNVPRNVAYMTQHEALWPEQTVYEALWFTGSLKTTRKDVSAEVLHKRIVRLLEEVGLGAQMRQKIGDPDVGGLSGGQRRRLSMLLETLANPEILLLDEPTTGLDSSTSLKIHEFLFNLTKTGCACAMTVHQAPAHYLTFYAKMLILSKNGRVVYFGPSEHVYKYLDSIERSLPPFTNPFEHVMNLAQSDDCLRYAEGFKKYRETLVLANESDSNANGGSQSAAPSAAASALALLTSGPSTPKQLFYLFLREIRYAARSPGNVLIHNIVVALMGVFIGQLYEGTQDNVNGSQNRAGVMFYSCVYFSLVAMSALPTLIADRLKYQQEIAGGQYSATNYFFSKALLDLLLWRSAAPLLFALCSYFVINLDPDRFLNFVGVLLLLYYTATLFSFMLSAVFDSLAVAYVVSTVWLLAMILLGGAFVNTATNDTVEIISRGSFIRFAWEALMNNEFLGKTIDFDIEGLPYTIKTSGETVLATFGLRVGKLWIPNDVKVLGAFIGIEIMVAIIAVEVRARFTRK